MGRVVILEGPDGSGKTTVAKYLVDNGFEYKHEGPPPFDVDLIDYYHEQLQESLDSPNNVVHDRLWLGERIYGPIMRNRDRVGQCGQILFERLMRSKPILQYICLPPFEVAKENYLRRLKEKVEYVDTTVKWEKTYLEYCGWVALNEELDKIFNYTAEDPNRILEAINSPFLILNSLPHGTIGNVQAKYLFIGDVSNHGYLDNPFFNITNSSGYFNSALNLAGIREFDLALTNAYMRNGDRNELGPILGSLPRLESIFLMGGKALNWFYSEIQPTPVESFAFKVYNIYHPAFLKRFKGNNPEFMAASIREALDG